MPVLGWDEEIAKAQQITTYEIEGVVHPRVRYGAEDEDWGAAQGRPCHDCAVRPGQLHVVGCDAERCPVCGSQALGCDCHYAGDDESNDDDERVDTAEPAGGPGADGD